MTMNTTDQNIYCVYQNLSFILWLIPENVGLPFYCGLFSFFTPLATKVGTKFRRQVAVAQSV
jgi:hypothetical protein